MSNPFVDILALGGRKEFVSDIAEHAGHVDAKVCGNQIVGLRIATAGSPITSAAGTDRPMPIQSRFVLHPSRVQRSYLWMAVDNEL